MKTKGSLKVSMKKAKTSYTMPMKKRGKASQTASPMKTKASHCSDTVLLMKTKKPVTAVSQCY